MHSRYVINGIFLSQRLTGIERYAINLVKELDKLVRPGKIVLLIPKSCNKRLDLKNIKQVGYGSFKGYPHRLAAHECCWFLYFEGFSVNCCAL